MIRRFGLRGACAPEVISRKSDMALLILRCVFLAVAIALGFQLASSNLLAGDNRWLPWVGFLGVLADGRRRAGGR